MVREAERDARPSFDARRALGRGHVAEDRRTRRERLHAADDDRAAERAAHRILDAAGIRSDRVVSSTGRTVPAGSVTSRILGERLAAPRPGSSPSAYGASDAAGTTPVASSRPSSRPAAGRRAQRVQRRVLSVLKCRDFRASDLRASRRAFRRRRCSGLTSTRRPDTVTPSFFSSVTVLPGLISRRRAVRLNTPPSRPRERRRLRSVSS